jgi:hypothetical protein
MKQSELFPNWKVREGRELGHGRETGKGKNSFSFFFVELGYFIHLAHSRLSTIFMTGGNK